MITRCPSCFREYDTEYGMCPHCGFSVESGQAESCCLLMGTEINDRYVIGGDARFRGIRNHISGLG